MSESEKRSGRKKRIFRHKDSILTELSRTDLNVQSLYHAFIIMIITGIVYSLLKDTLDNGRPDVAYYVSGFGPAEQQVTALVIWFPLQLAAFGVYPAFKLWEVARTRLGRVADVVCIILMIVYNLVAHAAVVTAIVNFNLPPVPALVLSVEQLRFTMKSYSFVRENAYKVIHPWNKDDETGPAIWYGGQMHPSVGTFSQYLYFLFAPTLLYRDFYPRIVRIRKLRVLSHLVKCCISVTFITIVGKEIFGATFPSNAKVLAKTFLTCMLWGLVMQFMAGYLFLHCWNNLFGELLRFADREFYSDWWTCTSFSQFYRKWNLLVHDWIKAYIYQDLKTLFNSTIYNKIAFFPTIIISAVFHEYVLWAPMRFVIPVLLVMFGVFGVILFILKPSSSSMAWNYMIHWGLHFGVSVMVFCYAMEFYARLICPEEENIVNTFFPRFYECFVKH